LVPLRVGVYGSRFPAHKPARAARRWGTVLCVDLAVLVRPRGAMAALAAALPVFFLISVQRLRAFLPSPLLGEVQVKRAVQVREREAKAHWIEEQRQKVSTTTMTFLGDEVNGIIDVRYQEARQRWAKRVMGMKRIYAEPYCTGPGVSRGRATATCISTMSTLEEASRMWPQQEAVA
jgi:hypothetical protein